MDLNPMLSQARSDAMTEAGYRHNRLITDSVDEAVAARPAAVALVDHRRAAGESRGISSGRLRRMADPMAPGRMATEVVSLQAVLLKRRWENEMDGPHGLAEPCP